MSNLKAHASAGKQWVYAQAGCDRYNAAYKGSYVARTPGQPLPDFFCTSCPVSWVENGWVEEGDIGYVQEAQDTNSRRL